MGTTVRLLNTTCAIREEVTEGTLIADTATSAVLPRETGIEMNLDRDFNEESFMTGSLSKSSGTAGMWGDDVGWMYPTYARGKGTLTTRPDFGYCLKSHMGAENINTNDTVSATTPKTGSFTAGTGSNDLTEGQLIMHEDGDIVRVTDITAELITVWPPLPAVPVSTDVIYAGQNYMLASSGHPTISSYIYLDGPKRFMFAGGRAKSLNMSFEVGMPVMLDFGIVALTPSYDHTAQAVTPTTDTTTSQPVCLGVDIDYVLSGTATGVPTTTETIISSANFDVGAGVDYLIADTGTGEWETVLISAVSGNPGGNLTLTHATLSGGAVSADDTVYVARKQCAQIGDTMSISSELDIEFERCMEASAGKRVSVVTGRTITISQTPYFRDIGAILQRDNIIGASMTIKCGSTLNNIFAVHIPNLIPKTVGISLDNLSKLDIEGQAYVDSTLGNDHEMVIATF